MKISDFEFQIDNFMLYCTTKNLSKKTLKSYEKAIHLFRLFLLENFSIDKVEKVQTGHIRQYIKYTQERGKYTVALNQEKTSINNPKGRGDYKKPISETTINNYIRNLKVFFNWLYDEREINKNPMEKISLLKTDRKIKETITEEEFKELLKAFDMTTFHGFRNYIMTKILLDTGMRIGECCNLKVDDLDIQNKMILIEKSKARNQRYVYISSNMAKELRRWVRYKDRYVESEYLFPTTKGTPLSIGSYETQLKQAGEKIGINVHPHQLRNNFAKYYLLNNGDFYTLSRILGHSSVRVTETAYMDLTDDEINKKYQKHSPLSNWNL